MFAASTMAINPDIGESHTLVGWWESVGQGMNNFSAYTNGGPGGSEGGRKMDPLKTISSIKDENLGQGEKVSRTTIVLFFLYYFLQLNEIVIPFNSLAWLLSHSRNFGIYQVWQFVLPCMSWWKL